jgi:GrpB-like predicted nucleotidyltransferase (UPF0157 family)
MISDVIVMRHDPQWANIFAVESAQVMKVVGENAIAIHHIGSTAIPSIVAKPIIDMLMVVRNIDDLDIRNAELEKLGYEAKGEFGILHRRYFRKNNQAGERAFHLHAYAQRSDQIRRHLAFRDFLHLNPNWAKQYSDLKLRLVNQHPQSSQAYVAGKEPFIQKIDQMAATMQDDP